MEKVKSVTFTRVMLGENVLCHYLDGWLGSNHGKRIRHRKSDECAPHRTGGNYFMEYCFDTYDKHLYEWLQNQCERGKIAGADIRSDGITIWLTRTQRRYNMSTTVINEVVRKVRWIMHRLDEKYTELLEEEPQTQPAEVPPAAALRSGSNVRMTGQLPGGGSFTMGQG
jgi:hypothetical protein